MRPYRLAGIIAALCAVILGAQLEWHEAIAAKGSISG
jgi:hypothetical protein